MMRTLIFPKNLPPSLYTVSQVHACALVDMANGDAVA